ncbi:hypothetical protein FQN57_005843 [Myotisia sp. PD_48]|nr:hypothetical protein FQN57_005843 [Myotisia sp. PD_48]
MDCGSTIALNASSNAVRSWISPPDIRGHLDIVISCGVTVVLCGWSSLCVSVPCPGNERWDIIWDKWHLFCLTVLGPEFTFLLALGQYRSACESVTLFQSSGYDDWTLKHGFFADMGGIVLQPCGWSSFPIDAKQLHYLVTQRHIEYPAIDKSIIDDKNKADAFVRLITLSQILWFTVNTLARPFNALAITTLELTTLGFIFCTFGTEFCWRKKPMDVQSPIVLQCDYPLDQILREGGPDASRPYQLTPLDFIRREEWVASILWAYYVNILRMLNLVRQRERVRPIQRFSSFKFHKISFQNSILAVIFTSAYGAIFVAAWDFHFPSFGERLAWQITSVMMVFLGIFGGLYEILPFPIDLESLSQAISSSGLSLMLSRYLSPSLAEESSKFISKFWDRLRNNSPNRDPALDIPLGTFVVTIPVCAAYTLCRIYILTEDIIGLRELPASVFQRVRWSDFWPHF